MLGMTSHQLALWRAKRIGPAWVTLPDIATVRYRRSVINAFRLLRQEQTTRLPALSRGKIPLLHHAIGRTLPEGSLHAP